MDSMMHRLRKTHSKLALRAQDLVESAVQAVVGHAEGDPTSADPFAAMVPWELSSAASLRVGTRSCGALDLDFGQALFEFAGVCHFRSALPPKLLERLRAAADTHTSEVHAAVTSRGVDLTSRYRFHEACQRGPGRTDVRLLPEPRPPFDDDAIHGDGAAWLPLVRRILGPDARLLFQGLVVSDPGTGPQALHSDGPHVPEQWRHVDPLAAKTVMHAQHPCHCLTVFLPLVDLTAENGATQFLAGTQHSVLATAALEAEASEAGSSGGAGRAVTLALPAGDAILFDYRLFHAGGANASAERRPMMYLIYARPWFSDTHNFPSREEASLQL